MTRKLRSPFVIVIAGAMAACAGETPQPTNQDAVTLPANPPRAVAATGPVASAPAEPADRDKDGIVDADDKCPDEPGEARDPSQLGCRERRVIILPNPPAPIAIHFDAGGTAPDKSSAVVLDEVAKVLKEHADIKLVRIEGHDDPSNPPAKALALSKARAVAVVKALVKRDVDATRLRAVGIGGYCPVDEARTPEARLRNHRAEFRVEVTDRGANQTEVGCAPSRKAGIK